VLAVELGSGALAGLCAILITVIILALILTRIMRRDQLIRIAQVGVFVRRERLGEKDETEAWSVDPLDLESETKSAPLPPPTPPPPLPPRPPDPTDDTQAWPQREEGP